MINDADLPAEDVKELVVLRSCQEIQDRGGGTIPVRSPWLALVEKRDMMYDKAGIGRRLNGEVLGIRRGAGQSARELRALHWCNIGRQPSGTWNPCW